jgi:type II secretory pathway component PulJ
MNPGTEGTDERVESGSCHLLEVVKATQEHLRQLIRQRAEIVKRIGTMKRTIVGLAKLYGDDWLNEELGEFVDRKQRARQPGFTNSCRRVLMEANRPLSTREVCEHLQQRVPLVLLRHKDPVASVTTVLNRLVEYGEALTERDEKGRRTWQWCTEASADATTVIEGKRLA